MRVLFLFFKIFIFIFMKVFGLGVFGFEGCLDEGDLFGRVWMRVFGLGGFLRFCFYMLLFNLAEIFKRV